MRDLFLTMVIFTPLPMVLFRPWIGLLLWLWISYMTPHRLTWSFAYNMPFVKVVAGVTLAGLVLSTVTAFAPAGSLLSGGVKPPPRSAIVPLLVAFWLWITFSTLGANYPDLAWPEWRQASETILSAFVLMVLFQDRTKLKYLLLVIGMSLAYFGVKSGLAGLITGFSLLVVVYPAESFIHDNNHLALALNTVLPFLLFLGWEERRFLPKLGFFTIAGITSLGVISTFSRGGFLGLLTIALLLVLRSRRKAVGLVFVLIALLGAMPLLLTTGWSDRIASIAEYQKDASAQGRLRAWKVATSLTVDSPLTGGGFRTMQPGVYRRYSHPEVAKEFVAHSIVFQVLAEHGVVGLGIFLALIAVAGFHLEKTVRRCRSSPQSSAIGRMAWAAQISLISYFVCGLFLNMAYFPILYHLAAIAAILSKLPSDQAELIILQTDEGRGLPVRPLEQPVR